MDTPVSWQYIARYHDPEGDLNQHSLTLAEVQALRVGNLTFAYVAPEDKVQCQAIKNFINRYEWLGRMSLQPTHRFTARYKGILAGVVVMDMPATFSGLLGDDLRPFLSAQTLADPKIPDEGPVPTRKVERLISRGASISWAPKNLASHLIMWAIDWMVKHTRFRLFTAYSDPSAGELGTIYQACSFIYLGQTSGTTAMYSDPRRPNVWFSDRAFRTRSAYRRMAKQLGIEWEPGWQVNNRIVWEQMPKKVERQLRDAAKAWQATCLRREAPAKGKYAFIAGCNKKEARQLRRLYALKNQKKVNLPYPKERQPYAEEVARVMTRAATSG